MSSTRPDHRPIAVWRDLEMIESNVKSVRAILEAEGVDVWEARGHLAALAQNTIHLAWRVAEDNCEPTTCNTK